MVVLKAWAVIRREPNWMNVTSRHDEGNQQTVNEKSWIFGCLSLYETTVLSQQTSHILQTVAHRQDFFLHFHVCVQFFCSLFFRQKKKKTYSQQIVCTIFQYPTKWRLHNSAASCQNEKRSARVEKMSQQRNVFFSLSILFSLSVRVWTEEQKGNVPFVGLNLKRKEKKTPSITIYFGARWMRALEINIIRSIPRAECEIHCGNICCRTHFWLCTPTPARPGQT